MLTDTELGGMREALEDSLPDTAVIGSDQTVDNQGGGGTLTFIASGTVDCRVAPVGANVNDERQIADRISADAEYVVTLPAGTLIDVSDRLTIDDVSYAVVALRAPRSWEVSRRVECKAI